MEQYTRMTRRRYRELVDGLWDGTLLEKWKERKAVTRADIVEERQIKAIGLIFNNVDKQKHIIETLNADEWTELIILRDGDQMKIQIYGRPKYAQS